MDVSKGVRDLDPDFGPRLLVRRLEPPLSHKV
jgi:hypothetical protein